VDESDEKSLLSFLADATKQASSNYDDPEGYIEGDFFILDICVFQASCHLRLKNYAGRVSVFSIFFFSGLRCTSVTKLQPLISRLQHSGCFRVLWAIF